MGTLFRSEKMALTQLFLQADAAYACVRELGELGKIQFRDLNPEVSAFQRKFVNEVRRCDEMERKLRFLCKEIEKSGLTLKPAYSDIPAPDPATMIDLETKFEQLELQVRDIEANREQLHKNLIELCELKYVLMAANASFEQAERDVAMRRPPTDENEGLINDELDTDKVGVAPQASKVNLEFVTGTISRRKFIGFEKILWRASQGNIYIRHTDIENPIEDPVSGNEVYKDVFVLFFQGENLKNRVKRICEGFRATLYPCPETRQERRDMLNSIENRIQDLNLVLEQTYRQSQNQLQQLADEIETWNVQVKKIKAIFHTMNSFNLDVTAKCLIAEGWSPVESLDAVQAALDRGTEYSGASVSSIAKLIETHANPPTYNKVNKFTTGFQSIVDAYGIANYQEVNPTPYTIITFPFLFAVMFGDAGHGTIMSLFALTLILLEKKLANWKGGGEIFETMYHGRYIILLMGLFSIYTGLIYNDVFSKSINLFGTSWNVSYYAPKENSSTQFIYAVPAGVDLLQVPVEAFSRGNPYPFGIDPIWQVATNKLLTLNSFKMKLSVILGVIHMVFGIVLSLFNHIHFGHYYKIIFGFIPEMLFLLSIFGWLVFLIIFKWLYYYEDLQDAPQLLLALINMFLKFGQEPAGTSIVFLGEAQLQQYVQIILVLIAVICVPWLLLPTPIFLLIKNKISTRHQRHYETIANDEEAYNNNINNGNDANGDHHDDGHFEFGEVFVHQCIHTIEFCLGCISNTASYLRLWALSLAHAQLSEVLWQQLFSRALQLPTNPIWVGIAVVAIFIAFALWAAGTIAVLLVMEGLSAFLHALRLHWVEFQNKFYVGEGYKFTPFYFVTILSGELD